MDMSTVKAISIPQGDVIKITDSSSNVLWKKKYGGIAIDMDNVRYAYKGGMYLQDVESHNTTFIAEVLDKGENGNHNITWGYTETMSYFETTCMREFTDLASSAHDYWGLYNQTNTVNLYGRYLSFPVIKSIAQYFYVYDNTNQRYLVKGDSV